LGNSAIVVPPLLDEVTLKKANATAINAICDPICSQSGFLVAIDKYLHTSQSDNGIFFQNQSTNIMLFA
jgi:type I restriction-modification system DNA methylase subunit